MPLAPRIPVQIWDAHKDTIRNLYVNEGCTLDKTLETLAAEHDFTPTKAQLVNKLGAWGFQKNVRALDWAAALPVVEKRKHEGKDTELRINNKIISAKRLKKRMGRLKANSRETTACDINKPGSHREAPTDVAAYTPPPLDANVSADVSGFLHERQLRLSPFSLSWPWANVCNIDLRSVRDWHSTGRVLCLPDLQLPRSIRYKLEALRGNQSTQQQLSKSWAEFEVLQTTIYMASNNMLAKEHVEGLLKFIDSSGCHGTLAKLLEFRGPSIDAFAEKLFVAAIQGLSVEVVRILLQHGVSPNRQYTFLGYGRLASHNGLQYPISWLLKRMVYQFYPWNTTVKLLVIDLIKLLAGPDRKLSHKVASSYAKGRYGQEIKIVDLLHEYGIMCTSVPEPSLAAPAFVASSTSLGSSEQVGTAIFRPSVTEDDEIEEAQATPELNEDLLRCVDLGDVNSVRSLLASGADAHRRCYYDERGRRTSPIAIAIHNRDLDMLQVLLDSGANPHESLDDLEGNRYGWVLSTKYASPLSLAIAHNDISICRALLEYGVDPLGPEEDEDAYPVQVAMSLPQPDEMMDLLFDYDASCLWTDDFTRCGNIWNIVVVNDDSSELSILLRAWKNRIAHPADADQKLSFLLEEAISNMSSKCVLLLLQEGADITRTRFFDRSMHQDVNMPLFKCENVLSQDPDKDVDEDLEEDMYEHPYEFHQVVVKMDEIIMSLVEEGAKVQAWTHVQRMVPILRHIVDRDSFALLRFVLREEVTGVPAQEMVKVLPLHRAIASPSPAFAFEAAEAFISIGADFHRFGAFLGARRIVYHFPHHWRSPPLHETIMTGRRPYDLNFQVTPLQIACLRGHTRVIRLLLRLGADINAPPAEPKGFTALQCLILAKGSDKSETKFDVNIKTILDAGADINLPAASQIGLTALQAAILMRNGKVIAKLMELGADVNAPASRDVGCTALQAAVSIERKDLVVDLLSARADVNAPAPRVCGRTALQAACFKDNSEIAELLLDHDADVNAPPCSQGGATALQYAAMNGNMDLLMQLLEKGADINAPGATQDGRTALQGAAEHGRLNIVQVLLQNDLEEITIGERCEDAAEWAEKEGHHVVAKCLRAWDDHSSPYCPFAAVVPQPAMGSAMSI